MERFSKLVVLFLILGFFNSCAPKYCPANSREIHHHELAKINQKRKRDKGLFPESMKPEKRKTKSNTNNTSSTEF